MHIKCAIQALFKALFIYEIEDADQLQDLKDVVTQALDTINDIPEAVDTDQEKFNPPADRNGPMNRKFRKNKKKSKVVVRFTSNFGIKVIIFIYN